MVRLFLVPVFLLMMSITTACADEPGARPLRSFEYHPSLVADIGPELVSGSTKESAFDRGRAYLLDIAEEEFSARPAAPIRNVWDRIRNGFALPSMNSPLVAQRELWYGQRKDLLANISYKARRYLYHVVEAVDKRRLPMELALLPIVESGFEPNALSTAQAAGLWQFIPGTAQRYKLKLTDHYDARRDIVASTDAALDYLEFLHGMFDDWQLALAAYNWGEEAVLRAIQRNRAKGLPADYENLQLPDETRHYVPKLMAVRNIVLSPELHGVTLADIPNAPYFTEVDVRRPLDVGSVARLAGLTTAEVLALNPSHRSPLIAGKGKPAMLLPADRVEAFAQNLEGHFARLDGAQKRAPREKIAKSTGGKAL